MEFGLPRYSVGNRLTKLKKTHPEYIQSILRDGSKRPRILIAEEGLALLEKSLSERSIPEGFSRLSARALICEFGVSEGTVYAQIRRVQEETGQGMKSNFGRRQYFITKDEMAKLREYLAESQGRGSRKRKTSWPLEQDQGATPTEPQVIFNRPSVPRSDGTEQRTNAALDRQIKLAVNCIDKLEGVTVENRKAILIYFLWQEDPSSEAKEQIAKALGITPKDVGENYRRILWREELGKLYDKFLKTRRLGLQNGLQNK